MAEWHPPQKKVCPRAKSGIKGSHASNPVQFAAVSLFNKLYSVSIQSIIFSIVFSGLRKKHLLPLFPSPPSTHPMTNISQINLVPGGASPGGQAPNGVQWREGVS